jgi:hypothetical protein
MSDNWYARARARVSGQPVQPQVPQGRAQPVPQYPVQAYASPLQQVAPVPAAYAPQQQAGPQTAEQAWANKLAGAALNSEGEGHRTNRTPCPKCGGDHYFVNMQTSKRSPSPSPRCFDCGYNDGMFEQGMQSSWAG